MLTSTRVQDAALSAWGDKSGRHRHGTGPLAAPSAVGVLAGTVSLVVVVLRVIVVGHGHVGRLVLAGSRFVAPGGHPGVPVTAGNGYDGQFYYRLALGPLDFSPVSHGVHMDSAARFGRIAYSALAWVLAGGRTGLVPWSLIAVNVVGLGVLGWLGAQFARAGAKHPAWGLLLPASFGFVWSMSRDLTEIVEATFLVGGLLAVRRGRPVVAGLALAAAALTRETALVAVGCVAVVQVTRRWRRPRFGADELPLRAVSWLVPLAVFVGWQAAAGSEVGQLPLASSGQHNLGLPLVGMARGFAHYASLLPSKASLLWFGELAVLVVVVVSAARAVGSGTVPLHERIAWGAYGVVAACLSSGIWSGDVGFRSLDDLYVLSCLVLLVSPRRPRLVAPCVGAAWLVVAVELIKVI